METESITDHPNNIMPQKTKSRLYYLLTSTPHSPRVHIAPLSNLLFTWQLFEAYFQSNQIQQRKVILTYLLIHFAAPHDHDHDHDHE